MRSTRFVKAPLLLGLVAVHRISMVVQSFAPSTRYPRHRWHRPRSDGRRQPSWQGFMASAADSEDEPWRLSNDFETFLNQCTIQSFMFLLKSLRDPHTLLWMENFTQPAIAPRRPQGNDTDPTSGGSSAASRLLTYHGLAAINTTVFPTWESYFDRLLAQPAQAHTVESQIAWAPDYELEIKPASLCSRIISVREQIANEWVGDLGVIADMGGYTLEAYWARLRRDRDADAARSAFRTNLLFLESDPVATDDYMPSPLRKGNFDLLCLLATQEAVHRVLNEPSDCAGDDRAGQAFLRDFYASRLLSHFTGSKWYGMADEFLEELLHEPPRTLSLDGRGIGLVDPTRLAERVLEARRAIALEWRDVAKDVPNRHMNIKRKQLALLMGKTLEPMVDEPFQ